MTKAELVDQIMHRTGISAPAAREALNAIVESIEETLAEEGKLTLTGFGTFVVEEHKARTGRNPRTGEALEIPARKVVKFRVGKTLQNAVK